MNREFTALNHLRGRERIFGFHNRAVPNHGAITIMDHNMPLADPLLCGRIRDGPAAASVRWPTRSRAGAASRR